MEILSSFLFWSFIAVAVILAIVGQVMKAVVFGKNESQALKTPWKRTFKQTMPLHPVLAGGLLGFMLTESVPEIVKSGGHGAPVLYFALSGALSTWIYNFVKRIISKYTQEGKITPVTTTDRTSNSE